MKHRTEQNRRIILLGLIMLAVVFIMTAMQAAPAYAEDSSDEGLKILYTDPFSYTDGNGVEWRCSGAIVNKDGKESLKAVIYGCNNAGPELVIPSTVKDSAGNKLTVIGVVSANTVNSDYSSMEFDFNYDTDNGISNIAELHFPDSVYLIGERAFASYYNAEDYTFMEDPYDTRDAAFALINTIDLPDNEDLVIGEMAFSHCGQYNGLGTVVKFGSKPITIKREAFWGCKGIESLTLPTGSDIAYDAFSDCFNIREIINAPAELYLGNVSIEDSPKLTTVKFAEGLTEIRGVYLRVVTNSESSEDDDEYYQYGLLDSLKNITIPSTAKTIGGFDHTGIEKITLPEGLEVISMNAFEGCTNLKEINFPGSLKEIEDCAFKDCVNLQIDVKHPSKELAYQYYNSGIRSITLRSDLILCYPGGLCNCPNLQNITIEGSSDKKNGGFKTKDGVLYTGCYDYNGNFEGWLLGKYPAGRSAGSYTVPSDVIGLDGFAFEGCKFSEIHIPAKCELELEQYMASISEGFNGDELIAFYPFDNMSSKPVVFVVKGSFAADMYETCDKYTVKYEPGYEIETPSQTDPAETPSQTDLSETPSQTDPAVTPGQTDLPEEPAVKVGDTIKYKKNIYKVTSVKSRTVAFKKAKNAKSVTVPATIKINGDTYKVKTVNAKAFTAKKIRTVTIGKNVKQLKVNAFKGSRATKIILKTKALKKAKVKGCLKGSKVKTIKVSLGKTSVNKKYVKTYKKIFTKKNAGKKVSVK